MPTEPHESQDIRRRMASGVAWRGMGQVSAQVIHLIAIAVVARLVSPAEFGVVGMAAILTGLVARLGDLGLGSAVIQRKSLSESQMSSVFWAVVMLGVASWLVATIASPLFARFMDEPSLVAIISVSAVAFVISSFGTTHRFLLLRDMQFRRLTVVEVLASVLYAVFTIVLALAGFGVWSLVVGGLVQVAAAVVAIWFVSKWRPHATFDFSSIRSLMAFGVKAWAGGLLGYAQESGDYFVIGRALGPSPLGFYTMAFNLANVPRTKLGSVVSMVSFAGFSRIQDDPGRVKRGFLRVMRYISLVSFPLLAGMLILASEFIAVVYGPNWAPSVAPLRLLSIAAIPASLTAAMPAVLLAKDRAGLHLKLAIASTVGFFGFVLIGVGWGISGVAAALLAHAVVFFAVTMHFVRGVVEVPLPDFASALRPAAVGAAVMAVAVALTRVGLQQANASRLLVLILCVLVGAAVYLGVLFMMRIPELGEVKTLLRKESAQKPRARTPVSQPEA